MPTTTFSPVVATSERRVPGFTALRQVDLDALGVRGSPVAVLDDFRVDGLPFSPHPHAGFAAVTYVFPDSAGPVRSRASSGADLTVGPGGIVWTHAGSGVVHEEVPAVPGRELHGVQLFINLSSANKLSQPVVLHLDPPEVPEWVNGSGDRVRVVVGSFEDVRSPLVPIEPFTLLDIELQRGVSFAVPAAHSAIVYVRAGSLTISAVGHSARVQGPGAVALHGAGAPVTLDAVEPARALVLVGAEIDEPRVERGPFIMNDLSQIEAAMSRYRSGAMGHLEPAGQRQG
ncbi:MAG TPA: pirin-like C-terminal cupin domain-containing protein [Acidimicrobiales bacterium]|nr:pirin-like C-terminal cupin domain-containing protein [Acidimicrobiales bacterium]